MDYCEDYEYETKEIKSFQMQALEITEPGANFDPTAVPTTGDEFLTKMLYERQKCPVVVQVRKPKVTNINYSNWSKFFPQEIEDLATDTDLIPTKEWSEQQLKDFMAVREKVANARLQVEKSENDYALPPVNNDIDKWEKYCRKTEPLLCIVLRLNQKTLVWLLNTFYIWLQGTSTISSDLEMETEISPTDSSDKKDTMTSEANDEDDNDDETNANIPDDISYEATLGWPLDKNHSNNPTNISSDTSNDCNSELNIPDLINNERWIGTWMYSILACLQIPLEPPVYHTLREIARECIRIRNRLIEKNRGELQKAVSPLNLFICLIAKAFNQRDFEKYI